MEQFYEKLSPHWDELEPNERRTLRQNQILRDWKEMGAKGYVLAVTGFGKTRVAENAIKECLEKKPSRVINIIVPHNAAKAVWEGVKERVGSKNIRIFMVHTYCDKPEALRKCDFLILDECHRFTNELALLFSKVIDATSNRWVMCLSATLTAEQEEFLLTRGIRQVAKVTMKEARECNYVARHHNWIVEMGVTGADLKLLKEINQQYHDTWKVFRYQMDEIFNALAGGTLGSRTREFYATRLDTTSEAIYGLARRALKAMRERKVFLQKAPSKIDVACKIVDMFPDSNIITFGEFTGRCR